MSCENVQDLIWLLLDGEVSAEEREFVMAHSAVCRQCGARLTASQAQRAAMRQMAQTPVPDALATQLRVMASHQREDQLARVSFGERVRRATASVRLAFDNLMRPVALPLTGGVVSALLLFGVMMPNLSFVYGQTGTYDFSTEPRGSIVTTPWEEGPDADVRDFPLFASPNDPASDYVNVVNFTIDESGRVVDWSVVRGHITDEMKSIIVFGRFEPATNLGLKTSGTIQVRQSLPPCKYARCSATVHG